MKIICVGYRDWALNIYYALEEKTNHKIKIIKSKKDYNGDIIIKYKPDLIFFYGWSWKVSDDIIKNYKCLMLHPSPLPKYRGGSPIQNQIIRGENNSAVTIFVMTKEFDAGNIVGQEKLSLDGTIPEIFDRIEKIGFNLTLKYLKGEYVEQKQKNIEATYFKRILKENSEITIEEILNKDGEYLYNKIRMLTGPYPNAFIRTIDNKRLVIKEAVIEKSK